MKQKQSAATIVAVLFASRDQAHRAHLLTRSNAHHLTLGEFYDAVVDLADSLAEVTMGTYGPFADIPVEPARRGAIDSVLEAHLNRVEDLRTIFTGGNACDRPIENILDEIGALYARTLFKLRNLS